jgi:formylglycine-generating enzyme required for sulfatase activity
VILLAPALVALAATPGLVPAGTYRPFFVEAAPDAGVAPPQPVDVPAFKLDVRQVTVGEFLEFVRAQPQWRRSRVPRVFADTGYLASWKDDLTPPEGSAKWAVTEVSWFAARAFCKARGAQLPTTAQWERAAEETGAARDAVNALILKWYAEPNAATRRNAGSGPPNRYGVRDLHGLVWEWVLDFNDAMVGGDVRDENGKEVKLFCGGGAARAQDPANYAAYMRFAFRSSLTASYTVRNLGFRCVTASP